MRRVDDPAELREADRGRHARGRVGAFGDPTVFLEQAVIDPRHIEVQILADGDGQRHPPVRAGLLGAAPPPEGHRDRAGAATSIPRCATASAPTRSRSRGEIGYVNAGTVEFLLDPRRPHVFIEMNPRIQVEHTVTEEVTDVDLVQSQLRIAAGETLADLGLRQDDDPRARRGAQCRITTEDPANGFRPDTGRITAYRSPGGAGIRLDGGSALPRNPAVRCPVPEQAFGRLRSPQRVQREPGVRRFQVDIDCGAPGNGLPRRLQDVYQVMRTYATPGPTLPGGRADSVLWRTGRGGGGSRLHGAPPPPCCSRVDSLVRRPTLQVGQGAARPVPSQYPRG